MRVATEEPAHPVKTFWTTPHSVGSSTSHELQRGSRRRSGGSTQRNGSRWDCLPRAGHQCGGAVNGCVCLPAHESPRRRRRRQRRRGRGGAAARLAKRRTEARARAAAPFVQSARAGLQSQSSSSSIGGGVRRAARGGGAALVIKKKKFGQRPSEAGVLVIKKEEIAAVSDEAQEKNQERHTKHKKPRRLVKPLHCAPETPSPPRATSALRNGLPCEQSAGIRRPCRSC